MQNPAKFREYAEQCKRLARTAGSEKDRKALLDIAEAWLTCAADAERISKQGGKQD
jgi:predicted DNA-binding ArsR family transcriptional regulator